MRIAVYGCGGVGGYFGGRLAQIGQDVTFIARKESLTALRSQGLKVGSIAGDFSIDKIKVTNNPAEVGVVDYVLCCVKTWQVPAAARAMKPMVGEETLVVPLQNGVEAPYQLGEVLDPANVLGGLCAIVAFQAGPGHIKHSGGNPLVRFGHLDNHADPRINTLSEVFNHCSGVKSSIPEDIIVAMWQKFMLITPWSGLGAVSRAPLGILLEQPETRELLTEATEEIYRLGLARGIALPDDSVAKTIAMLEGIPPNSTTSMQRDLVRGRPSELDAQNGAVVRLASEVDVATPVNRFFLYGLRSLELRARGALSFNRRSSSR
ncbi:MAG: 2-dehydropantoate 2-reductase [Gammaproteobacteria bacterium]|nr:2-dehydropantoate 2-reductase [Gammaproteobacteria bacterium]MDH3535228.1 2-dehydropantoate 2-reductase [Gammaproteobacteria bacterium]